MNRLINLSEVLHFINEGIKIDNDLCLMISENNFTIFKPEISAGLDEYDTDMVESSVLGSAGVRYNNEYKCYEIDAIYATSGYGPTLYLIIASWAGKKGLMPNTSDKVSDQAKAVWKEFTVDGGKGSSFITKKKKIETNHQEDHLNYIIYSDKVNVNTLIKNGLKVIGKDQYGERKEMIIEAGDSLLSNKMRGMY